MLKLQVFVSHLHIESRVADLLRKRLTRDFKGQLEFFVSSDATSTPVGKQWFDEILAGMARAHLQFVICSGQSVERPWLNYESGACRMRGIDVLPLCHSGVTPGQLPVPLGLSQGAQLTDPKGLRKVYARIAALLDEAVPSIDFTALAAEFKDLEAHYLRQLATDTAARATPSDESIVERPRVVCATSQQFLKLGYRNQLKIVLRAFPTDLKHDIITSGAEFERVLQEDQVDIVHIAAYVCARTGVLYFSDVELPLGIRRAGPVDFIRPAALSVLLKNAGTRLVVIASGDSLVLATDLLGVTNVIVPRDIVSAQALARWVTVFYGALRTQPLSVACAKAAEKSQARMQLLTQQTGSSTLEFGRGAGRGRKRAEK